MDGQDSGYGQNIVPLSSSHYSTMMSMPVTGPNGSTPSTAPLTLSTSDVKYNMYDTSANETKPFQDVSGMIQQIMSIVDQTLDEAQTK